MKNKKVKAMMKSVYAEICWNYTGDGRGIYTSAIEVYRPFILLNQVESM